MHGLPAACLLALAGSLGAAAPGGADPTAAVARAMAAAEASLEVQEHQAAESHYRSALQEGWLLLGGLETAAGDLAAAQAAYERAAASAAETRRAHTALALVLLRRGAPAAALTLLRRIVAARPEDGRTRRLLAQALVAAGSPEEAVQELEEVLTAAGGVEGDAETAFALATGYLRIGKIDRAEELLARIGGELPGVQTQVLIGRTYRDFRRFERARSALETALELDPGVRRAHYYLGTVELLERGRDGIDSAVARFRRELAAFPRDPVTHLYLGMALTEERHFEEALASLEIAAEWEPTRLDGLRFIGRCHLGLDRPAEAVLVLQRALELAQGTAARPRQLAAIHYQLATALRRRGAAEEAAVHFAAAEEVSAELVEGERERFAGVLDVSAELEPAGGDLPQPPEATMAAALDEPGRRELRRRVETELARAYLNLGVLQARDERFGPAAELFAAAAELDPELPGVQASLGSALFNAGRRSEAAAPLERALAAEPEDAGLQRMLALSLLNSDAWERAAALLRDDPGRPADPALEYAFGLALVRSGRAEEAERVFARLVAEHADWPELHVFLGQAHARQGDFEAAVASLEHALELAPAVAEASAALGVIYLKQGRLDAAEQALRAELAHRPGDVRSRYHLAVVLDLAARPDAARAELQAVLRAQPDLADARYLLGKIRLAQGAAEDAALHLEAAAALAPEDANIRYQLAQAYQRLGRTEQASREFDLYRDLKQRQRSHPP